MQISALEPLAAAEIVVVNLDAGTGAGLHDPTPRPPAGGNPGATLGQQRQEIGLAVPTGITASTARPRPVR